MPGRADPFSLLVHLMEKWWQRLVTQASIHIALAKSVFLAASDFRRKDFTALSR